MECPLCSKETQDTALFCRSCGYKFSVVTENEIPVTGSVYIPKRDMGRIIMDTLKIYRDERRQFPLLALIALAPNILLDLIYPSLLTDFTPGSSGFNFIDWWSSNIILASGSLILLILGIFSSAWATGAAVCAVFDYQLGRPVQASQCIERAWKKIGVLCLTSLLFTIIMIGSFLLMLIIIGIPIFFYFVVAFFFYSPAIMLEDEDVIGSLGRSRQLVSGSWWRVFGIGMVIAIILSSIYMVANYLGGIISPILPYSDIVFNLAINIILLPIGIIAMVLVYTDLRVRKEGYTHTQMVYELGRLK